MPRRSFAFLFVMAFLVSLAAQAAAPPSASVTNADGIRSIHSRVTRAAINAPDLPKAELEQLQDAHLTNIRRLYAEGKPSKAGPTEDEWGGNVRGIFILTTDSVEQARSWVGSDPLIQRGRGKPGRRVSKVVCRERQPEIGDVAIQCAAPIAIAVQPRRRCATKLRWADCRTDMQVVARIFAAYV